LKASHHRQERASTLPIIVSKIATIPQIIPALRVIKPDIAYLLFSM
jgi:hypothetical protein